MSRYQTPIVHALFVYYPGQGAPVQMPWCLAPRFGQHKVFTKAFRTTWQKRNVTCVQCKAKMWDWEKRQEGAPMPMEALACEPAGTKRGGSLQASPLVRP